ncbi:hypothetical protein E0H88_03930 [Acinetobacter sp. ANC 4216]|uniref:hypothetical protein n=1 Tax=Acinetobacter sp. ANC 4216 TaxID=2529840 RepID=UPI00104015E9|nr:hypothetical protein [Acinetobacter sp. ANC 4216]TCB71580.1 hypothetical protein E0H88_03930 [Acinetobacter sp. ANC 4216]
MPDPNENQKKEQDQFCFQLGQVSVDKPEDGKKKRTFSGIAYSGEAITDHWYWDKVVFDLDSIQIKGRIPALLEHRTSQRVGAINSHSISHAEGLKIEGNLLSNEFGTQVAQDSDDDFPWQMSVRIYPTTVEEVKEGSIIVNGRTFQAPVAVFRGGRIREVSFCALGADDNTNAVAASHSPKNFNQPEDTDVDLEQAKAKIKEHEQTISGLQDQVKKFATDKRNAEIDALAKALNKEFSADEKSKFAAMPDDAFDLMAGTLKQFAAGNQQPPAGQQQQTPAPSVNPAYAHLFTHQANGGQGGQAPQGSALDQAFAKFAAAQESK